jgi:hypothetical protein
MGHDIYRTLALVAALFLGCGRSSSTARGTPDAAAPGPIQVRIASAAPPAPRPPTSPPTAIATPPTIAPIPTIAPTPTSPSTSQAELCAQRCKHGDECPSRPCHCEDSTTVSMRFCQDGCCAPEEDTCSKACASHDGPAGSWNAARDGNKTGAPCANDHACASGVCLHGACTKKCATFGDCPPFWSCSPGMNGFESYCRKD